MPIKKKGGMGRVRQCPLRNLVAWALPIKRSGGMGTNGHCPLRKVVARAEVVPLFYGGGRAKVGTGMPVKHHLTAQSTDTV